MKKTTFSQFILRDVARKQELGKYSTAVNYRRALASFSRFLGPLDPTPEQITPDLMERFQAWLVGSGVCSNSISFYMRALRACYCRAVRDCRLPDLRPFDGVFTGIAKTPKRAISETDMRRIKNLQLTPGSHLEFVRDMFLLSFYLMGISFVDLAFLRKTDLRAGVICYERAKTGRAVIIAVNDKIRRMLDKHPAGPDSPYLLPIIKRPADNPRRQYSTAIREFNKSLKKIGERAGVAANLSTYTQRHTWASLAKMKDVRVSVISEALGHSNEAVTRIYLAQIDCDVIRRANDLITRGL